MESQFAMVLLYFVFLCLRCSAAEAELNPPQNLTMITLNTNYTLSWDWDKDPSSAGPDSVTFTVECIGNHQLKWKRKSPRWRTACENTTRRSCDLTGFQLSYLGLYVLRVRAIMGDRNSKWAKIQFCADKDAAIGPPSSVRLSLAGEYLDVHIMDPVDSFNNSMREHIPTLQFQIHYWEHSEQNQVLGVQMVQSSANLVTLSKLKSWTWYCVMVQSRHEFYNKNSSFTSPECLQTEGPTCWWQIFLYFLGSLAIIFLAALFLVYGSHSCYRFCKSMLFPDEQFPFHFKQPLFDPHITLDPRLALSDSDPDLFCDDVILCPKTTVLEVQEAPGVDSAAPPAGLEQDSNSSLSRQGSNSSRDSGVFSSGENFDMLLPNICTDVQLHCEEHCNLERMKLNQFRDLTDTSDQGVCNLMD